MSHIITQSNCFIVRWNILPECKDDFFTIWDSLVNTHIEAVKIITKFAFFGWSRDPNVFVTIECYRDEAELAQLRKSDNFQQLVAQMLDCCSETVTIDQFSGMEIDRSVFDRHPQGPSTAHPRGQRIHAEYL